MGFPGEHADMPGVKPWQYQGDSDNEGSGPYAQRSPTLGDYANHEAATSPPMDSPPGGRTPRRTCITTSATPATRKA